MPLYEYRCNNCNRDFEKVVSFSEADLMQQCPTQTAEVAVQVAGLLEQDEKLLAVRW